MVSAIAHDVHYWPVAVHWPLVAVENRLLAAQECLVVVYY